MSEEANEEVVSTGDVEGAATVSVAHDYTKWPTPPMRKKDMGVGDDYWRSGARDGFVEVTDSEEEDEQENFRVMAQMTAEMQEKAKVRQFANELIAALNKVVEEREQRKNIEEATDSDSSSEGEYILDSSENGSAESTKEYPGEAEFKDESQQTSDTLLTTPVVKRRASLFSKLISAHPFEKVMRSFSRHTQTTMAKSDNPKDTSGNPQVTSEQDTVLQGDGERFCVCGKQFTDESVQTGDYVVSSVGPSK